MSSSDENLFEEQLKLENEDQLILSDHQITSETIKDYMSQNAGIEEASLPEEAFEDLEVIITEETELELSSDHETKDKEDEHQKEEDFLIEVIDESENLRDEIKSEEEQLETLHDDSKSEQQKVDESEEKPLIGTVDLTKVNMIQKAYGKVLKDDTMDFMDESYWIPWERDRTTFSERCQRGDYPIKLLQKPEGLTLQWMVPVKELDYQFYLTEFIKGLNEPDDRYQIIANLCVHDLIDSDKNKVKTALPYFMNDLYVALSSRYPAICINACKILQKLAKVVGKHLGYYFDRIFGVLNMMRLRIEYIEGQKTFIKTRDLSLHPLYEEILKTWCILQDILIQIPEKQLKTMMQCWVRPLPWLTF